MKRQPFVNFTGTAAPLPRKNINTDAIIPAPYLRTAEADLGQGLFALWRYDESGAEIPDFVLNKPGFRGAEILIGGENFGCGSSREAAAWALVRYGIKAVFAPGFADIFYENAFRNGLLAGVIARDDLDRIIAAIADDPARARFSVDLNAGTLCGQDGHAIAFSVPSFRRDALLRGDDDIAATLAVASDIDAFMQADAKRRPWIYETGLTP